MLCTARTMPSQDARLSVTGQYSVETAKHILKLFHHRVAIPFQFFHTKVYRDIPVGIPTTGASNARGYKKITDLRPISRFISEMIQDRAIVTVEGE